METNPSRDSSAGLIVRMTGRGITSCAHPKISSFDRPLIPQKTPCLRRRAAGRPPEGRKQGREHGHRTHLAKAGVLQFPLNQDMKAYSISKIAVAYARAGNKDKTEEIFIQACNTVYKITDSNDKSWILKKIVFDCISVGMLNRALEVTKEIDSMVAKAYSLKEIASEYAKAGNKEMADEIFIQAVDEASRIKSSYSKWRSLAFIGYDYSDAGGKNNQVFFKMLEAASEIADTEKRVKAFQSITAAYVRANGNDSKVINKILEKANEIEDSDLKYATLAKVAQRFAKSGIKVDEDIQKVFHKIIASL